MCDDNGTHEVFGKYLSMWIMLADYKPILNLNSQLPDTFLNVLFVNDKKLAGYLTILQNEITLVVFL